jgi:GMP synthase-like glutamine amidotransferase
MSRVLVVQHAPQEGPGYLAEFLERRAIPWELARSDSPQPLPADPAGLCGLVLMGGPMSANDPLPWIPPLLDLVRQAVARDVPVLGHCLGGQLLAKALGAPVTRNPVPEVGWLPVDAVAGEAADDWLAELPPRFAVFQWHGETFALPPGARRLLSSPDCLNQAFALGPHLGLQCHVEMTPALVRSWVETSGEELEPRPTVHSPAELLRDLEARSASLHRVADALYARWLRGVRPRSEVGSGPGGRTAH